MTSRDLVTQVATAAGLAHFIQIPAMLLGPRLVPALRFDHEFDRLSPLVARIVRIMVLGIMMCVFGLGLVVVVATTELTAGNRLGTALALFLAVFWGWRGWVQAFVYARLWPGGRLGRVTHCALLLLFTAQAVAYLATAVHGLVGHA